MPRKSSAAADFERMVKDAIVIVREANRRLDRLLLAERYTPIQGGDDAS